jgi:hypothetical protein
MSFGRKAAAQPPRDALGTGAHGARALPADFDRGEPKATIDQHKAATLQRGRGLLEMLKMR